MNAADMSQTLEILGSFAKVLDSLGISGIVGLLLAGPGLMLCALYIIEFRRNQISTAMVEGVRREFRQALDVYRDDTRNIVEHLDRYQARTDACYREAVELARSTERIAAGFQDVVVSNTAAITRLCVMLEERRKM